MALAVRYGPFDAQGPQPERKIIPAREQRFTPGPALFTFQPRSAGPPQEDILGEWNRFVGGKLDRYRLLVSPELAFCEYPQCNPDSFDRSNDERRVKKIILKETANFARKKGPWIDTVIRYTTLQIRHNASSGVSLQSVKDPGPLDTSEVTPRKTNPGDFSFKGGFKTNFIDGSIGFVAEAQARYRLLTAFYRFDPGKRTSVIGMEHPLRGGMLVQVRHESSHAAASVEGLDLQATGRLESVKLIYQF